MEAVSTFTAFDIVVLLILFGSAIIGMFRGFSTEVLTLASWAGAILVTLYGVVPSAYVIRSVVQPDMLADSITAFALFMVSLAVFKLIAARVGDGIKSSTIGILDRSLGMLFGLFRGLLIVFAGFLLLSFIIPENKQPSWIVEAKLAPMVSFGADLLTEIVPDLIQQGQDNDDVRGILDDMREKMPSKDSLNAIEEMKKKSEEMKKIIKELEKEKVKT
jgi:membrane protein required for colicin V production